MNTHTSQARGFPNLIKPVQLRRGLAFGAIIITALLAFEIFNYSTTDFALTDLLGDLRFLGVRWATILSIAFCGIDFAGIARLFTPEEGANEPAEVWYLFGAWLLAATMNAMLTWWGVSLAILNHETLGNAVISRQQLLKIVPVFVAVLVWLIRVLIIGTFSVAGERLFSQRELYNPPSRSLRSIPGRPATPRTIPSQNIRQPATSRSIKPAPKPVRMAQSSNAKNRHPEPTYHPLSFSAPMQKKESLYSKGGENSKHLF